MNGWLESVQGVLATLANFFQLVINALNTLGDTITDSFNNLKSAISLLPPEVAGIALIALVVGVVFLVIGR